MKRQMMLFDSAAALKAKEEGMSVSALSHEELLELAQEVAVSLGRIHGRVHMDMVQEWLIEHLEGYEPADLGNAAGSVFRGDQWIFTGQWYPSARVSNHCRMLRVWRLREQLCG